MYPGHSKSLMQILGLKHPIVQAGMVWVSGGKLAAAAAEAGCLGVIGAGSMKPEMLQLHIEKAQKLTDKKLAVNIPLLYKDAAKQIEVALKAGIKFFITSAGSPKTYTSKLKDNGAVVMHVTSTPELAIKCEKAGVDIVIAEGFEAGGHNGREEITTMVLIPQVVDAISLPVIAAGGIVDARGIAAALALGASAVQMGTRFVATKESSAHDNFKQAILNSQSHSTKLMMKKLVPVRLMKNHFYEEVEALEKACASSEAFKELLGKGRAKAGMLDGDLKNGELEIGQGCSLIKNIPTVSDCVNDLIGEYEVVIKRFLSN